MMIKSRSEGTNKDDETTETVQVSIGYIPVMLYSVYCNLHDADNEKLIKNNECLLDNGGYFIINGNKVCVCTKTNK